MALLSKTASYSKLTLAEKKARTRAQKKAEEEAENQRLIQEASGECHRGLLGSVAYRFRTRRTTTCETQGHRKEG